MICRHDYAICGMFFASFGSGSNMLDCDWRRKDFQKRRCFYFLVVKTRLFCKAMCTITTKHHNCRFLVPNRNIQNVEAGFALFKVVESSRFIGSKMNTLLISTCWTNYTSNSNLFFVVHTQIFLSMFRWFKWDGYQGFVCWVPSSSFFSEQIASFVCFCCL